MADLFSTLVSLYGPLLMSGLCIVALFRFGEESNTATVLHIRPLGEFADVNLSIAHPTLIRIVLATGAAAILSSYGFYDYAQFFPTHFKMDVFFDDRGLSDAVNDLSAAERTRLKIIEDFQSRKAEYFAAVDQQVRSLLKIDEFYNTSNGVLHSTGETSFVVESASGWQRYHISEARGELTHTLEIPGQPELRLLTIFERLTSSDDYFNVHIVDILWRWGTVLRPRFKQLLTFDRATVGSGTFRVAVVGVTKVEIFPWPKINRTVYCADVPNVGLVPIAYAVYR